MTSLPPPDAEFNRKLALGLLSVLQQKGLITSDEVDAILYTARRAALEAEAAQQAAAVQPAEAAPPALLPPAEPRWVRKEPQDPPPPTFDIEL